jgi:hypothetical protein
VVEDQSLVNKLLDGFQIRQELFLILMGVFHEGEMAVDFI